MKTMVKAFVISHLDYCKALCYGITDKLIRCLQPVQNAAARRVTGTRRDVIISRLCALASYAAARRVQDCDSRLPVLVRQRPGLPGRRLSARRRRPCQTTAFCRHSNSRSQSDAQQFWRQDLCLRRTTSLEQSAAQFQIMWAAIRSVQSVTEDIFIRTVRLRRDVNCF